MIYLEGEKVVINLNIESFDENSPIIMGTVVMCKEMEKKTPGTLIRPTLTQVQGDDGKFYYSLKLSQGISTPNVFMNSKEFETNSLYIKERLQSEISIFESYQNLYMDDIQTRIALGIPFEYTKKRYEEFILSTLEHLKAQNRSLNLLFEKVTSQFNKGPTIIKIEDKKDRKDDDNGDDNDT